MKPPLLQLLLLRNLSQLPRNLLRLPIRSWASREAHPEEQLMQTAG
jgi:hypothetical protein